MKTRTCNVCGSKSLRSPAHAHIGEVCNAMICLHCGAWNDPIQEPTATTPERMSDHTKYHDLQQAMRQMIRAGQLQSDAFQDAWRQSNDIINRHGGMPPMPDPDETIDDENQILAETGVEMGVR